MTKKLFTTAALVCCFMICLAAAVADLNGKWSGPVKSPEGEEVVLTYVFKIDGNKLTGTGESNGNTVNIDDGKIDGNDITFKVTTSEGDVIPHTGKFYPEADSISMNIDYKGAKLHTTLKRVK
ncbi:hypothetical protein [Mucilaginibacter sp. OK098]|jgi:hypothetical protein|uniref:hypothetical protein n=1 Tax=Mucilaginibacter sp. OK098 TaxID=1855297 RepID=UPI00091D2D55|nr:hypothetical protein [Mucilaginibacter sp. OK098]SHM55643.1 hypothetical protein SAMN05216524_102506 [Mucilaginibacter sp. OK098]